MSNKVRWIRGAVQIAFFIFVFAIVFSHFIERRGIDIPWPAVGNFHAICPFGAVETAGRLITEGSFIPKIHDSNIWTFAGVAALTLLFGSLFCGWLCPLGSVQEWIGRLGKRIFKKRYNRFIGEKTDRALGYVRYGVLALILYFTTSSMTLVFQRFDPYYALFHFWTGDVFFTAILVLGVVIVLSLFFERPWCRWLCPLGALLGLIQFVAPWKIRKKHKACSECGVCMKRCPMRVRLHEKGVVRDTRCNRCLSCLEACKKERALEYSAWSSGVLPLRRRVLAGALAVGIFAAPIVFASSAGYYNSSGKQAKRKGSFTVEEIKGSMTLGDIAGGMGIDAVTLKAILGLPETLPQTTRFYELEEIDESFTTGNLRAKIVEYKE